jgi:hypothetical protein
MCLNGYFFSTDLKVVWVGDVGGNIPGLHLDQETELTSRGTGTIVLLLSHHAEVTDRDAVS